MDFKGKVCSTIKISKENLWILCVCVCVQLELKENIK